MVECLGPMPVDSTLSHTVERIPAYVAQDKGDYMGTIMTAPYMVRKLAIAQEHSIIFLYGAGLIVKSVQAVPGLMGFSVQGFIVTKNRRCRRTYGEFP